MASAAFTEARLVQPAINARALKEMKGISESRQINKSPSFPSAPVSDTITEVVEKISSPIMRVRMSAEGEPVELMPVRVMLSDTSVS